MGEVCVQWPVPLDMLRCEHISIGTGHWTQTQPKVNKRRER